MRKSPMNPIMFNAINAVYPLYMANLKASPLGKYAKHVRHISQQCVADTRMRVTQSDVLALCHVARLAMTDRDKAFVYVRGACKPIWTTTLGTAHAAKNEPVREGITVQDLVMKDFEKALEAAKIHPTAE